ncbi:MAG: VCBS repeat-containing protein, partial [Proteobacteria bacterium]|nr:VCBS repeat-containing protein [Pseudomonadota bacterium]
LGDIDAGAWSRPFVVDLDGNGLLDVLIGHSQSGVKRYEQTVPNSYQFVEQRSLVLMGPGVNNTHASLHDLDGDGAIELILGTGVGTLQLYRQHSAVADSFLLVDDAWCGVEGMTRGAPCIADVDGDGLLDLLLGCNEGSIMHLEQPASGALDGWEMRNVNLLNTWDFGTNCTGLVTDLDHDGRLDILRTQASEKETDREYPILRFRQQGVGDLCMEAVGSIEGVTAGYFDMLAITDFENDARLDLLVARSSGQGIEYYRQSESNPAAFDLVTNSFLTDIPGTWTSLVPVFFDLDRNGRMDLLLASSDRVIHRYEQRQAGSAEFVKVKEKFMQSMPFYVAPAFADLGGDG